MPKGAPGIPKGTLPIAPFLTWADRLTRARFDTVKDAEISMGIKKGRLDRAMRRCRHQEVLALTLRMVDDFFVVADEPHMLAILYPQDDLTMEDRWCPACVETATVNDDLLCPWCESETDRILPVVEFARWYEDKPRSETTP
jgi:hypothetical protein